MLTPRLNIQKLQEESEFSGGLLPNMLKKKKDLTLKTGAVF